MEAALDASVDSARPEADFTFDFPRTFRVRCRADYRHIQGRGRRLHRRDLLAIFLPGECEQSRFGLTVSRKVGGAVVRNRVKRMLREAVRHERHCMVKSWDIVFIARSSAAEADAAGLRRQVHEMLVNIDRRKR
jgi:ribonuclease P protein component